MSPGRRPLSFSNRLRHIYQITRSDAIGSADDVGPPAVSDTSSISLTSGFLWLGVNQSVTGEYACVVSVPLIRGELQRNHQSRNDIIISRSPRFFFLAMSATSENVKCHTVVRRNPGRLYCLICRSGSPGSASVAIATEGSNDAKPGFCRSLDQDTK